MPRLAKPLQRHAFNEEYCNNLLLGALKFSDPVIFLGVLKSLAESNRDSPFGSVVKELTPENMPNLQVDLQPALRITKGTKLRDKFGKESLEADAWIWVGDCLVIVEGEFQKWIDAKQMFQQLAIVLLETNIHPDNLFWLLLNGRCPSGLEPCKPERTGMSKEAENLYAFVSGLAGDAARDWPRLAILTDHYLRSHYLWQTWEWLAQSILDVTRGDDAPRMNRAVREEIERSLGEKRFRYHPPKTHDAESQ